MKSRARYRPERGANRHSTPELPHNSRSVHINANPTAESSVSLTMASSQTHIVLAGGGTGGHLFPGLALAEELVEVLPGVRITFAGSGAALERAQVAKAGFDYLGVPCRPFGSSPLRAARFVAAHVAGFRAAWRFLRREQVSLVVGLGGYASVPAARAAARLRLPLVLLEQNAVPGRANAWLAPKATLICTAFEESRASFRAACPVKVTGTPIREGLVDLFDAPREVPVRPRATWHVLVLGGSSGARSLNESVPRALYHVARQLKAAAKPQRPSIVHQTGAADAGATQSLYRKLALDALAVPFIENMPNALAAADVVISRAGGTTLAELAAAGAPAVLVPYPHATDNHQRRNADLFKVAGAALVVDPREKSSRLDYHLADAVRKIITSDQRHAAMSAAMHRLARPDAAWDVATMIHGILAPRRLRAAG